MSVRCEIIIKKSEKKKKNKTKKGERCELVNEKFRVPRRTGTKIHNIFKLVYHHTHIDPPKLAI